MARLCWRKTPNDPDELLFSDLALLAATKLPRTPKPGTLEAPIKSEAQHRQSAISVARAVSGRAGVSHGAVAAGAFAAGRA